ncbi:MAG: hypothetical protein HRT57_07580 [Crocinitomicaceae bacterium]|nr:hypothetical protein [Crocinitomicaceae bacterium]
MKYRILSQEELELLEDDLKAFLIVNGVHGDEWTEMNKFNPVRAVELVELFSDTVLQKVYDKIRFIEHRSQKSCMVFNLKDDKIDLISINANEDGIDLTTPESIHEALSLKAGSLSIFRTEKMYLKDRAAEIHEMLEQGCVNSSEAFWMQLEKVV